MERQLQAIFLTLQEITVLNTQELKHFIVVWTKINKCEEYFSADIFFSIVLKYIEFYIIERKKRKTPFNFDKTLPYNVVLASMILVFVHHSDYKMTYKIVKIPGIERYNKRYLNLLKSAFLKSINYKIVY